MKEELLKMAQECLSEEEVKEILRNKFKESIESAIEKTFRWGKVDKHTFWIRTSSRSERW